MQYKNSTKIVIDKRKLDILLRLNCPKEIIYEAIVNNKIISTDDELINDNIETLIDIKTFNNWGGNRSGAGRKCNNSLKKNQDENQDENQDANQDINQVVDKDIDKDIDIDNNKLDNIYSTKNNQDEKSSKEQFKILGEFQNVKLTEKQISKLQELYGQYLNDAIEIVSSYVQSTGKKYKDFYAVLGKHNWVYKKMYEEKIKNAWNDPYTYAN